MRPEGDSFLAAHQRHCWGGGWGQEGVGRWEGMLTPGWPMAPH